MPKVLAQSNLPNNATVVVSSETIILRDPNNRILEKYTSDEQKQLSLKSYGIKPTTMLSPGENKYKPVGPTPIYYDWIRDEGDAYIATGFIPKSTTKIQVDFKYIDGSPNYFFGVDSPELDDPSIDTRFAVQLTPSGSDKVATRVYWKAGTSGFTNLSAITVERTVLKIGGGYVQLNENTPVAITDYDTSVNASKELFIFAWNRNIISNKQGNTYIFSFRIYDETDNLLMDLKPATLDGVPGLFDEVSNSFFRNAAESGSFIVGNGDTPTTSLLNASLGSPSSSSEEEE